jgi:hypothetical protein
MSVDGMPEALREAVTADPGGVRPLRPASLRVIFAAAVIAVILAFVLANASLRADIENIPIWLSWGCSGLQLVFGVGLIWLALREAVPGGSAPRGAVRLAAVTALGLQVLIGVATSIYSPAIPLTGSGLEPGLGCLKHEALMALPTFAITLWLVFRALPLRAPTAGLLGGAGATVASDAAIHLLCPMSNLSHVLLWHTGAVVLFMATGWILGVLWDRLRWSTSA